MTYTTDKQNAIKALHLEIKDIKRKSDREIQDAYRKYEDCLYDYAQFWTRPQISDNAFDVNITWRDIWLALWGS